MGKMIVLFNAASDNGRGGESAKKAKDFFPDVELEFLDVREVDTNEAIAKANGEPILLCGGDGTLNHFINEVDTDNLTNDVYFFGTGTGNDFLFDIGKKGADGPIKINKYIKNLPTCIVKGKKYKFINGIGYGIDGYCCEEGDKIRATSDKPVNYTAIAIKGLLGKYKPTSAKVTVDGVTKEYKQVWLSPAMNGRCYGGGMLACPDQNRLEEDKHLSNLVFYGSGKLKTLMIFPKIFKGEHVKHTKHCEVTRGKTIKVEFDRPVALQVDGETILDVTSYEASVAQ